MNLTDNQEKQKAIDLAEDSRQSEWQYPSFVAELFAGRFRWDLIHPYPVQTEEDQRIGDAFIAKVQGVLEKFIDPQEVDRTGEIPREGLLALADLGCFGLKIPTQYGGLGMSQINYSRICAFIASYCASTSAWVSAHQSVGLPEPLKLFGTPEQKQRFLPRLAKGALSGFALTEPDAGSDPARMTTTATPSEDGAYYVLNGEKLWCTNGPAAELLVVMSVTPPKFVRGKERKQITAFIVETDTPGFEVAHICSFMGLRGIRNGLLRFTNVRVPKENRIGNEGDGLRIAFTTLNTGRLTIPYTSATVGKGVMHLSQDWCRDRVQWGQPIGQHQTVGAMLARISAETFAMESMSLLASAMVDRGGTDIRLEAAMAKYYCTETSWRIADDFVQIRGGRGYETFDSLAARGEAPIPAERILRDCRISRIVEGTSEIMRLFIAREALDGHIRRIMPLMDARKSFAEKKPAILAALKFYAAWYPKQWLPHSVNYQVRHLAPQNFAHLGYIARASRRLARTMVHTMAKHREKLERQQVILQGFVDIGTDLFAMSATLARTEQILAQGDVDAQALQDLTDFFCRNARERIDGAFRRIRRNHNALLDRVAHAYLEGRYDWMVTDIYSPLPAAKTHADPSAPEPVLAEPEPLRTESL